MSLRQSIQDLQSTAAGAMALFQQLKAAADLRKNSTIAQRGRVRALASKLDTDAKLASRARRDAEIDQLTRIIDAHAAALATPGLSAATKQAIRATRTAKVARRGRLRAQVGTDFAGVLTKTEVDRLVAAVAAARLSAARKRKAAAFLKVTLDVAQNALQLAGKLMM